MVTNMKQWNGKHGCLYCEDEGKTIGRDQLHRYWPYLESARPRSHASLLKNAEKAINTADVVSNSIILGCYNDPVLCTRTHSGSPHNVLD